MRSEWAAKSANRMTRNTVKKPNSKYPSAHSVTLDASVAANASMRKGMTSDAAQHAST